MITKDPVVGGFTWSTKLPGYFHHRAVRGVWAGFYIEHISTRRRETRMTANDWTMGLRVVRTVKEENTCSSETP